MFWKKKDATATAEKLPGPRDIPSQLGSHMVTRMNIEPDLVWNLRAVIRPNGTDSHVVSIRLFQQSTVDAKKVKIKNYDSFNDYPELVLFEGTWDKKNRIVKLEASKAK